MAKKRPAPKKTSSKKTNTKRPKAKRSSQGRPPGSKHVQRVEATVVMSRCPKCNSTNRTRYDRKMIVRNVRGGTEPLTGKPCTHAVFRMTQCVDCGQARRDVTYEFEPSWTNEEIEQRYPPEVA